ncbi:hypothetical protein COK00_14925 [Bacillus cereus]|uniref:Group-specific protein n=2 Tax=Bacillus cereus group TaxID=86661 RepID=A0A2B1IN65_BACCE|nr:MULTISPECIES: hypothetical protein [Bacillus cereus group]ALQ67769.1 hypothetical protein ATN06_10405 [Bacillus thuringiensis]OUA09495.1 hypothetical protein BK772_09605 [Bacillus thuringiensis serovar finitimus]PEC86169.1 hypothetical protein CON28_06810 [Bacillus cereus]PEQ48114.1 hypothetical protein CN468_15520 [Bacillus cereus]PEX38780.1 hypothetical protein CN455_08805 [Bacillus cereus]
MGKIMRTLVIIGILIPPVLLWSVPDIPLNDKLLITGLQLTVGFTTVVVLEIIFKNRKKKRAK